MPVNIINIGALVNAGAQRNATTGTDLLSSLPLGTDLSVVRGSGAVTFTRNTGVYVNDFENRLTYVASGVPAFEGARYTNGIAYDTLDTGEELITNQADRIMTSDTMFWSGFNFSVTNNMLMFLGGGSQSSPTPELTFVSGKTYRVTYTLVWPSGSAGLVTEIGTNTGVTRNTSGVYTEEIVANGPYLTFYATSPLPTGHGITNVSIKEVVDAIPLHPWTYEQGVKRYLTFDARANGTVYAVGKRIHATASDGLEYWYTCTTAGTSHSSAPTFPITGTVAEGSGTVVWTYGGLYRSPHLLEEPASTNKCTCYGVPRADSLGSELITVAADRDFSSDTGYWVPTGVATVIGGGSATITDSPTANYGFAHTGLCSIGTMYQITFTVASISGSGALGVFNSGAGGTKAIYGTTVTAPGTYTKYFLAYGTITGLVCTAIGMSAVITAISIKAVTDPVGVASGYNNYTLQFAQNIPNMTLSGDVAAVLSIVTDATELANAKLEGMTNGNKVYRLQIPSGSPACYLTFGGTSGSTTARASAGILIRCTGTINLRDIYNGTSLASITNQATYVKFKAENLLCGNVLTQIAIHSTGAADAYFVVPQLECEAVGSPAVTSIMPTLGATASRAATVVSLPVAGNIPVNIVLGSELLQPASNRDFSGGAGIWSNVGGGTWAVSGGNANGTSQPDGAFFVTSGGITLVAEAKKEYELTATINLTSGGIALRAGGVTGITRSAIGINTYTERFIAVSASAFGFVAVGTTTATLDNFSVKEVVYNSLAGYQMELEHFVTQTTGTQMIWCIGDTTNGLRLFHTGAVYVLQKIVSSVSTYVTIAKALVLNDVNQLLVRVNSDWTCNLFCNGVKDLGGLGVEKFVNGSFTTDSSWDKNGGAQTTISGGLAVATNAADLASWTQSVATLGKVYAVGFDVVSITGGVSARSGVSPLPTSITVTGAGYLQTLGPVATVNIGIQTRGANTNGTFDNATCKEVYNNTDTTPIVLGTTLYLGADSAGASHINGGARNLTVKRRAYLDAENIAFTSVD